jgi:hypothetical protein
VFLGGYRFVRYKSKNEHTPLSKVTIVGSAMPNLTYMLVFPDDDGLKAAWGRFRTDPDWLKMRAIPEYADKEIVSRITNRVLIPASYSEI